MCQTLDVTLHEWTVASALIERDGELLLVRNVRQGGREDWSTPGGVIDQGDPSILDGLAREVHEETGLRITRWDGLVYEVVAVAADLGWRMRCEVHLVAEYEGEVFIDDPDGIVVEANFYGPAHADGLLLNCPAWVREPISEWINQRWDHASQAEPRRYEYAVGGTRRSDLVVKRC